MALTAEVKDELTHVEVGKTSVRAAELATILRFSGGLHLISGRIAVESELDTPQLARRVRRDLSELYGVRSEMTVLSASGVRRTNHYLVRVVDGGETLARQTGLLDARRRPIRGLPNRLTTGAPDEIEAVWRGAFLAHGSLTDPGRSAALEVTCPGNETAMALVGAAGRLQVPAKAREVRGVHRVVIRDGEAISDMLGHMGAKRSVQNWEDLRQRREVRANTNRLVNFDDANLRRSAQAAVAACARVERALEILGDSDARAPPLRRPAAARPPRREPRRARPPRRPAHDEGRRRRPHPPAARARRQARDRRGHPRHRREPARRHRRLSTFRPCCRSGPAVALPAPAKVVLDERS